MRDWFHTTEKVLGAWLYAGLVWWQSTVIYRVVFPCLAWLQSPRSVLLGLWSLTFVWAKISGLTPAGVLAFRIWSVIVVVLMGMTFRATGRLIVTLRHRSLSVHLPRGKLRLHDLQNSFAAAITLCKKHGVKRLVLDSYLLTDDRAAASIARLLAGICEAQGVSSATQVDNRRSLSCLTDWVFKRGLAQGNPLRSARITLDARGRVMSRKLEIRFV